MKRILMFTYSIVAYAIGFAAIMYWILSVSNLIPSISIDQAARVPVWLALANNIVLIALFGVQHSVMARGWFKDWFTQYFPKPIERSTFVLISGVLLFNLVHNWQPLGGIIWQLSARSFLYYASYVLFFAGWAILLISSFLINHFDLFGLRQTFLELQKKPYTPLKFRIIGFYKYVRHPLYTGMLLGMWVTPIMSYTHLALALAITVYVLVGVTLEEKDLVKYHPKEYKRYQATTSMLIPFTKELFRKRPKLTSGGTLFNPTSKSA